MWTVILATYAAVVSTSSLAVSYLSYRSGGPQLSGDAEIGGRYDIQGPTLHVDLYNRGRGPITVDSIMLWGVGIALEGSLPVAGWPLRSPGCVLPSRIEGHSGAHWHFPAHDVAKEWLNRDDLTRLEVQIGLATGKTLALRVDTSNIDVLDGRNLPDWQPDYFKDWPKLPERQPPSGETSDRSPATSAEIKPSRTANELDLLQDRPSPKLARRASARDASSARRDEAGYLYLFDLAFLHCVCNFYSAKRYLEAIFFMAGVEGNAT
jgi:hypothetical protein